ncbi:cytochrome c biogenesis protein ResB [Bacillus sp. FSL W7-1360]
MKKKGITCECNYVNVDGTEMCAACGKPLTEKAQEEGVNMRYEGAAIRSRKRNKSLIDHIWGFFSSVKVGIWILVLLLISSALGTLYPQKTYVPKWAWADLASYYEEQYGTLGHWYYTLGLHELYDSWWYIALIIGLAVSIIVASFDRGIPLYKALRAQRVTRHPHFMKRQRFFGVTVTENPDEAIDKVSAALANKRYRIRKENGNVLAEKNRFARWGPYVNHVGLIIFLGGCLLRYIPGMEVVDTTMAIREGEKEAVPFTDATYFVENRHFSIELYDENDERFQDAYEEKGGVIPEKFETDAVLYKREESRIIGDDGELVKMEEKKIHVNDPLQFDGFSLYQTDYRLNELNQMTFTLEHKESGKTFGEMTVDLIEPESTYELGDGYRVVLEDYFPDFDLNSSGEPTTKSSVPNNPYFLFSMYTPDKPEGERSLIGIQRNVEANDDNEYKMTFVDAAFKNVTILTVRKDETLPFLIVGGIIFLIGLVQGSYFAHRRVWLQKVDGDVWLAGHTNRNGLSFHEEMKQVVVGTPLHVPKDQEEMKHEQ